MYKVHRRVLTVRYKVLAQGSDTVAEARGMQPAASCSPDSWVESFEVRSGAVQLVLQSIGRRRREGIGLG